MSSSTNNPQIFPTSTISEDTLHYTIHLPPSSDLSPESYAALITSRVKEKLARYSPFEDGNWLWHKDAWELKVVQETDLQDRRFERGTQVSKVRFEEDDTDADANRDDRSGIREGEMDTAGSSGGRKLEGRMRIGDSVDDEWLVVWLLRDISSTWPGLLISIRDTDGDFLLIEAANHLPKWVTPTNAQNRLWLASGHLHLVPPDHRSPTSTRPKSFEFDQNDVSGGGDEGEDDDHAWLNEHDATRLLRRSLDVSADGRGQFYHPEIEGDVWERISGYPDTLQTHHHRAKAYLPINIAKALKVNPALGQRAVEGFYTRDAAQLRLASRATKFPPTPATSVVLAPLVFTRTAYAQLKGQVYHPPRVFGPEWRIQVDENGLEQEERERAERERKYRDLGVKLIMGFEIMFREDNKRSRRRRAENDGNEVENEDDLARDKGYLVYLENLAKAGWFEGEMKGSAGYQAKEKKAAAAWRDLQAGQLEERISFAQAVDDALADTTSLQTDDLKATQDRQDDSEAWLEVSPDELDGMLSRAEAGQEARPSAVEPVEGRQDGEEAEATEQAKVLRDLAKKVNQFVEAKGDMTGATFDDELSDDDMVGDSDDESEGEQDDDMDGGERERRLNELVPGLAPEEWGSKTQKPEEAEEIKETAADKPKRKVSFATGTKTADETDAGKSEEMPSIRPPILEPENYDGHIPESDDDMSDWDPADDMIGGWAKRPSYKTAEKGKKGKKRNIDPSTYVLQKALRTGQPMPRENLKEFDVGDRLDMSDDEEQDDNDEAREEAGLGEPDMEAEQDDFLRFAREALGINDEMWKGMMGDRKARGVYVPEETMTSSRPKPKVPATPKSPAATESTPASTTPQRNPKLDSFERVMDAMEAELAMKRQGHKAASSNKKPTSSATPGAEPTPSRLGALESLPTEADLDDMDEDDLIAMDRELRAALKSAGGGDDEDDDVDMMDDETRRAMNSLGDGDKQDVEMMKDLLGSYKAQAGASGVVGNLFGRLNEKQTGR